MRLSITLLFIGFLAVSALAQEDERQEVHITQLYLSAGYQSAFQFSDDLPRIGGTRHGFNIGIVYEENFSKYSDGFNWAIGMRYSRLGRRGDSLDSRTLHCINVPVDFNVRILEDYGGFIMGGFDVQFVLFDRIKGPQTSPLYDEGPSNLFDAIPYLGFVYKAKRYRLSLQAGKGILPQPYGYFNEYYLFNFGYHLW